MVLPPLKNTWMPYFLQVFFTLSPRPLMYGTVMYVLLLGRLLFSLVPCFYLWTVYVPWSFSMFYLEPTLGTCML